MDRIAVSHCLRCDGKHEEVFKFEYRFQGLVVPVYTDFLKIGEADPKYTISVYPPPSIYLVLWFILSKHFLDSHLININLVDLIKL